MSEVFGQPKRFWQMGVCLVKSNESWICAGVKATPVFSVSVEPEFDRSQPLGKNVTIPGAPKAESNVGFMPLQAHRPKVGRQIDVDPWIFPTKTSETGSEKML